MSDPQNSLLELQKRWIELCERINAKGDYIEYFTRIEKLYLKPPRFYHTFERHIASCLYELDEVCHLPEHPDEVEISLTLHDIIFNTRRKDNEERSAQFAYELCKEMGLPDTFNRRVYCLILPTRHEAIPKGIDAQVVVDVDLSPLGLSPKEFDENERKIRKEYSWVPEKQFNAGRADIIKRFLDRSSIYSTDHFRQKYGDQAERNLKRLLKKLLNT